MPLRDGQEECPPFEERRITYTVERGLQLPPHSRRSATLVILGSNLGRPRVSLIHSANMARILSGNHPHFPPPDRRIGCKWAFLPHRDSRKVITCSSISARASRLNSPMPGGRGLLPFPLIDRIQRSELGYEISKLDKLDRLWRGVSSQEGSKDWDRYRHDCDGGLGGAVNLQVHRRCFVVLLVRSRPGLGSEETYNHYPRCH